MKTEHVVGGLILLWLLSQKSESTSSSWTWAPAVPPVEPVRPPAITPGGGSNPGGSTDDDWRRWLDPNRRMDAFPNDGWWNEI